MTRFGSDARRQGLAISAGARQVRRDNAAAAAHPNQPLLRLVPATGSDQRHEAKETEQPRLLAGLLDVSARAVIGEDGRLQFLTRKEFALLRYLCLREGETIDRDELLREIWGVRYSCGNVINAVVVTLRRKLGSQAARLQTVRGFGFRLEPREATCVHACSRREFLTEIS